MAQQKKNTIAIWVILLLGLCQPLSAQSFQAFDSQYQYYYGSVSRQQSVYYRYYVPANKMGVFTLKSTTGGSNYNLYSYTSASMNALIDYSANPGSGTELLTLPVKEYGRWVYVKLRNVGSYGEYRFYAHTVDVEAILGEALLIAILEGLFSSGDEVDDRNLSRGLNLAASVLKNSSFEDATRSFIINELTSELRKELGYGAIAGFFVNYIVLVYDEALKNVW